MTDQRIVLRSPRYNVIMGDPEDETTWEEYQVRSIGRDQIAAEELFGQEKLGKPMDSPLRFSSAMAYFAMVRTGRYVGSFHEFTTDCIEANAVAQEEAFPTVPEPAPA
jgi:hypothetical protein